MKPRPAFYVLAVAFVAWAVVALSGQAADEPPPTTTADTTTTAPPPDRVQGKTAREWHAVAARYLARRRSLARALHFDATTSTAIGLACVVYGHCSELWRKASCESHLYRYAHNPSGA